MKTRPRCGLALRVLLVLSCLHGARAQTRPVASAAADTNAPTPAQYALALLKPIADQLSAAKTFRFKVHSMVEVPSPTGQLLNYFSTAEVTVERPNKIVAKRTGDGPAFDLYCNGRTFSGVDPKLGLYAQMAAPATLDELIPLVIKRTGMALPYADMLYSDVYGAVSSNLTHAYWVEKSSVDGVVCDHLAFAGPEVEWQVWVGPEKSPTPRRLAVTYLRMERQPRFLVNFTDWDLKASTSAQDFEFKPPAGAKLIEFKPMKIDR